MKVPTYREAYSARPTGPGGHFLRFSCAPIRSYILLFTVSRYHILVFVSVGPPSRRDPRRLKWSVGLSHVPEDLGAGSHVVHTTCASSKPYTETDRPRTTKNILHVYYCFNFFALRNLAVFGLPEQHALESRKHMHDLC